MSEDKWWVTLYDLDDRIITACHVGGWSSINAMLQTFALRHHNIEYIKIEVKPPDRSVMFFDPPDEP